MEAEKTITEPNYSMNINFNSKTIEKTKKKELNLPLLKSISNLERQNRYKIYRSSTKSVKRKRMATALSLNKNKFKLNKDLDLVYKLNMEIDVDQIFEDNFKLKKEKEKIDNNPDIKAKRLNIYKNNEKNGEKKIEIDAKEKEKYIEKDFKDELEKLEKIKNECNMINVKINQIVDMINEYKMEISVYDNYSNILDKQFLKELKEKEKEKKLDMIYNNEIVEQVDENEDYGDDNNNENGENDLVKKNSKKDKFEQLTAFTQMKQQRENRIKFLEENIKLKEDELKTLKEKQNDLIKQCKEKKNFIYKLRKQLLNIYHINLYEGLNFRTDGLCSLIRSIWNLGVNVDVSYMPSYLDNDSIEYLFDRTKRLIDISKMRQLIEENKKEFEQSLKQWKQANLDENNKATNNTNSDSNFFQTGVMEKYSYDYMDKYPRSKQFMEEYNKKYFPKQEKIELNSKKKIEFKSKNIPYGIIDKHNKIEKLKYLLKTLIEQNDLKEKKEIERLCKEFTNNNYEEKYNVSVETIMGALCGEEKRNEGINFFNKFQREYKEGKKLIQFHKNINRFSKKNEF